MNRQRIILIFLAVTIVALGSFFLWRNRSATAETAPSSLIAALSEPALDGYARATEPNAVQFPRDFGPHDEYQTEWWYYTGNLDATDGREYGFQFTIFRRALTPPPAEADPAAVSAWRTNQVYLVHFTVSDIAAGEFYHSERYSRGAAGLAGAQAEPYRVWVEDWEIAAQPDGTIRIAASADGYALDLSLTQTLPPILHGSGGLSAKSLEPGNASYYYSQVQQLASGSVQIGDETIAVTGKAWKDHEYSTSVLSQGAIGWDWLSLQFDDGTALMLFEIRRDDGSIEPASNGTFIYADGTTRSLAQGDWLLTVDDRWRSPVTGAQYPVAWSLTIPSLDLALTGTAQMPNQELTLTAGAYWEGAVRFAGARAGMPLAAEGYIELTGYAEGGATVVQP